MQFNNTSSNNGLIQDCEIRVFGGDFGAISGNTKRLQVFTNLINQALDKVTYELLTSSNTWQWDNYNETDFPEADTDLISGQQDYSLDVSHLVVREVSVLDSAGQRIKLIPIDEANFDLVDSNTSIEQFFDSNGTPKYFDLIGNSIRLYPAPNYNMRFTQEGQRGLQIKTLRAHEYFTTADTTKTPGFASIFHPIVSALACAEYAVINTHENVTNLVALADKELKKLQKFQSSRQRNRNTRLIAKYRTSR